MANIVTIPVVIPSPLDSPPRSPPPPRPPIGDIFGSIIDHGPLGGSIRFMYYPVKVSKR